MDFWRIGITREDRSYPNGHEIAQLKAFKVSRFGELTKTGIAWSGNNHFPQCLFSAIEQQSKWRLLWILVKKRFERPDVFRSRAGGHFDLHGKEALPGLNDEVHFHTRTLPHQKLSSSKRFQGECFRFSPREQLSINQIF